MKERVTLQITSLFKAQIGGMSEIVLKNMNTLVFKSGFHGFHPYSSERLISQFSSFDRLPPNRCGFARVQITRT